MSTIKTPDQRLRVFVSSTLQELAPERAAARRAIETMRLSPILFELGARPHPPQDLYRAYLEQSQIFVGIYWQSYGWKGPGMSISGLEDEYQLAADKPKLLYIKTPAPDRQDTLDALLDRIRNDEGLSYKQFIEPDELQQLIENDLALLLTEHFESVHLPTENEKNQRRNAASLPTRLDSFVGREVELLELSQILANGSDRLITMTGPGGIGKTRLALEAARRANDTYEDGIYYVPLSSVTQPEVVIPTIVQALDVKGSTVDPLIALMGFLSDRHLLLVLDNFEQVLPASTDIARLAEACPNLTLVITSRSTLNLRAEREYQVVAMNVPETDELEGLARSDAIRLFVDRATAINQDFTLSSSNAKAIAEICRQLDGLPLALELAAARTRLLGPDAMLDRLHHSLNLLTSGSRDVPQRHQTLRSAIDWSYKLLSKPEQTLFTRMAAFQGGCTLEAAEAVCNPRGDLDLLELMTSLLEKSLIKHELRSGEPRFSMLKTIWEYANELLNEGGDNDLIRSAHSDFFLTLISAAHDGLRSAGQVAWLGRLERDCDNLRTALRWCLDHDQAEAVAEAGWTLWLFWWLNAHLAEGKQLMDETLERGGLSGVGLAKARAVKGCMAFWQGDYPDALPLLAAALESFHEHHDLAGVALCQLPLGFVEGTTGSPEATRERLEQSVASFKQVHDEWGTALAMNALCWTAVALDLGVGDEVFEEALARAEKLGTELDVGMALRNLGTRRADEGHNDEAKGLLVKALRRLWRGYVHGGSSYTLEALAEIAAKEGNPDLAVRLFAATDAIREKMNSRIVPMFVPRFEDFLNGLRSEMGAGFELAWDAGRRLSMNDAVGLALAWADGKRSDAISVEAGLRNGRTSTLT